MRRFTITVSTEEVGQITIQDLGRTGAAFSIEMDTLLHKDEAQVLLHRIMTALASIDGMDVE